MHRTDDASQAAYGRYGRQIGNKKGDEAQESGYYFALWSYTQLSLANQEQKADAAVIGLRILLHITHFILIGQQ